LDSSGAVGAAEGVRHKPWLGPDGNVSRLSQSGESSG
jgi:hypothetical protein